MTYGIYRPTYTAYKAALDKDNNLIAFHVRGGGIPEHAVHETALAGVMTITLRRLVLESNNH
jgi:hypothetical protein